MIRREKQIIGADGQFDSRKPLSYQLAKKFIESPPGQIIFGTGPEWYQLLLAGSSLAAGTLVAVKTGLRMIRPIRGGNYAVEVRGEKFVGSSGSGWKVREPTGIYQKYYEVDGSNASAEAPGGGNGFLADGTKVEGDLLINFKISGPQGALDFIERIASKDFPFVNLSPEKVRDPNKVDSRIVDFKRKVGSIGDATVTERLPMIPDAKSLRKGEAMKYLNVNLVNGVQFYVDRLFRFDKETQEQLDKAIENGDRRYVDRGVVITGVQLIGLKISKEVEDAWQEEVAVVPRMEAQSKLREALGTDYSAYINAEAAQRVAETGAPTVIGLNTAGIGDLTASERFARRRGNGGTRQESHEDRMARARERMEAARERMGRHEKGQQDKE